MGTMRRAKPDQVQEEACARGLPVRIMTAADIGAGSQSKQKGEGVEAGLGGRPGRVVHPPYFPRTVNFQRVNFGSWADFSETRFAGSVDFSYARFSQAANFVKARFVGPVQLVLTEMAGEADFHETVFEDVALFQQINDSSQTPFNAFFQKVGLAPLGIWSFRTCPWREPGFSAPTCAGSGSTMCLAGAARPPDCL